MESKTRVNYGNGLYGENNTIDFDKYLSDEMLPYTSALLKSDFEFYIQFFYRAIYKDYFRTCWFHKEIIKSLEEFVYGNPEKKNLAISIPPRWGKSILMIMWISWCFGIDSTCNFIYTCYEERITNKMSDDILNIIRHPFYQRLFGVQMNSNTEAKALWETKEKGTYRASPMGGAMTGFGCFDKDTPIWTENGVEKIGDIVEEKKNVRIMTFDGEKISFEKIERYVKNDISQYKRIIFEDGEVLDATNDHIFHTTEGEKRADELSVNSVLLSVSGGVKEAVFEKIIPFKLEERRICAITDIDDKPSYCLTLNKVNNLFVGISGIFVHNCGKIGDRFGGAFIIDDPLNAKFFNSEVEKKRVEENYQAVIKKRLNNPAKTPIVLIMQRLAVDDLVGYIEANEADDWKIIRVPALNEDVNPPKSNWEWKSPTEVLLKEKKQSPYIFAAQMQQSPVVLGGELVKEEWFKFYNPLDTVRYKKVFFTADTAFKTNEWNDYTAVGLWAITEKNDLRLIDLLHKKIEAVDLLKEFFAFKNRWSGGVRGLPANVFYIEDKASGMELIQRMRREGGVSVIPVKDKGFDKMTKWNNSLFPYLEAGNVLLPNDKNDPRSKEIIAEMVLLCGDGSHKHDDICDMMTQAGEIAFGKKGMF